MKSYFLNDYLIQHFRLSGYYKHPSPLPEPLVDELISAVNKEIKQKIHPYRTDENNIINRLDNLYNRASVFKKLAKHSMILQPLESLIGPNIELVLNRHNHATINQTTLNRHHRDILQWSRSLITVIIYLEDATIENGCTEIIPSSHLLPFHGTPNNGGTWLDENSKYSSLISQALPIPMNRGGILFFDSLAFHDAGKKISDSSRLSIAFGYHSVDELSGIDNSKYKVLVNGKRIYRGNIEL